MGEHTLVPLSRPVTSTNSHVTALPLVLVSDLQQPVRATPLPPATVFPRFDGENPKLWKKATEKYFRLFSVEPAAHVEYATMHFSGNAALWLQRVEDQLHVLSWEKLCELLHKQFYKGHYQLLYRQLFKLRQPGLVSAYVEKFNSLMHHMLAYKPNLDPTFFTTRFIEGLAVHI
jgi:hypothetical protein